MIFFEKENYKILAIRTLYEIASLHPRLKHTRQRAEFEERVILIIPSKMEVSTARMSYDFKMSSDYNHDVLKL